MVVGIDETQCIKSVTDRMNRPINISSNWSLERVSLWLERQGYRLLIPYFKANDIQGEKFLNITINDLIRLIPETVTTLPELQRLAISIQELKIKMSSSLILLPLVLIYIKNI
ncbi:unnamed protein product [Cunninghamella echinulata]